MENLKIEISAVSNGWIVKISNPNVSKVDEIVGGETCVFGYAIDDNKEKWNENMRNAWKEAVTYVSKRMLKYNYKGMVIDL